MSLFGCKALFIVISFLVLCSIYLNSSLVHFKNGPDYLTKKNCQNYLFDEILAAKLVFNKTSHLSEIVIFPFLSVCLMVSISNNPKFLQVSFSLKVLILSWFSNLSSLICSFLLFIISITHLSVQNSIPISWLYIFIVFISYYNFFSFNASSWMLSILIADLYWMRIGGQSMTWLHFRIHFDLLADVQIHCSRRSRAPLVLLWHIFRSSGNCPWLNRFRDITLKSLNVRFQ